MVCAIEFVDGALGLGNQPQPFLLMKCQPKPSHLPTPKPRLLLRFAAIAGQ
jgi:hypothetical protein